MRLASALSAFALSSTALAAVQSADIQFSSTWASLPTLHFSVEAHSPVAHVVPAHAAAVSSSAVDQALVSAAEITSRRDLAVDELAAGWETGQRAALEDLRDAQRAYAAAAGGDRDARGQQFVALLKQVIDGSGRSAPDEGTLSQVYARVIRDATDDRLATIEASETAWIGYRDAFGTFARAMDRPDAAATVRDELAHHRADELEAEARR